MIEKTEHGDSTEHVDLTGRTMGDYVLLRRLGRGGMADVYLADQKSLNRQVAFKTLHGNLAKDRKYVERFHREAKAAAALNQPNIVQIYEVGEIDGVHFIVQEYIRGQNLKQYLQRHTVAETILAINVIRQVCAALQRASEYGVIHRDIKPENIMLTPSGDVKVTDFGLARVTTDNRTDLTQIGITMGTPLYMSPEQVEGKLVDPRSDIYSLGVTAFQMLVGRPPFEGETPLALAVQHIKKNPPPLAKLRPDLPLELCELIEKMMAKNPANRFQTPAELIKALRKIQIDVDNDWVTLAESLQLSSDATYLNNGETLAATRQLETIMTGHLPRWWRSTKYWLTVACLSLFGIGTGLVLAASNQPKPVLPEPTVKPSSSGPRETVDEQYRWAYTMVGPRNDDGNATTSYVMAEQAWTSVRNYFPPDEAKTTAEAKKRTFYCRLADVRLGELYLQNRDWTKANKIYNSLALVEDTEEQFRTVGHAGLAVVYHNQSEFDGARAMLYLIEKDIEQLNSFMRFEIELIKEDYFGQN